MRTRCTAASSFFFIPAQLQAHLSWSRVCTALARLGTELHRDTRAIRATLNGLYILGVAEDTAAGVSVSMAGEAVWTRGQRV